MKKHFLTVMVVVLVGLITTLTGCELPGGSKKVEFEPGWYKLEVEIQGVEEIYYFLYDQNGYIERAGTKTREWDTEIASLEKSYSFEEIAEDLVKCSEEELPLWASSEKTDDGITLAARTYNILKNIDFEKYGLALVEHYFYLIEVKYDQDNDELLLGFGFGTCTDWFGDDELSLFPGVNVPDRGTSGDDNYRPYFCIKITKNIIEYIFCDSPNVFVVQEHPNNYFMKSFKINELSNGEFSITFANNDTTVTYKPFVLK